MELELVKSISSIASPFIVVALGWLVGVRISTRWAIRQKNKEINLVARNDFYRLYGEFFAVWKLWNHYKSKAQEVSPGQEANRWRWDLLNRACAAEAGIEALLLRLVGERKLDNAEVSALGKFRQAYQTLRQKMGDDETLSWSYSGHPEYLSFKRHACFLVALLDREPSAQKASVAQSRFVELTDNKFENNWVIPDPGDQE
jgi:hypothetical protein